MLPNQQILCPNCRQPDYPGGVFCSNCGHDMVLNNAGPRYYITRVIKAGGQGAVYEAVGEDGKVYAVKEMLENFENEKERVAGIARFEAEAALLQRLSHPRIPKVYTSFNDEGRRYLAMDFVRGKDLGDVADERGPIPEAEVLRWAEQICDVLGYLHANGLIYRDMKPSNVMLEPDGNIKLIDFGIAKVLQQTKQGTQVGTPGYAPPEQYQGLADVPSDVFALAATLHHLLTGRDPTDNPPFSFPPARSIVPAISQRTSDALQQALRMNPEERFLTVAAFWDALRPQPAVVSPPVTQRPLPTTTAPATTVAATGTPAMTAQAVPATSGGPSVAVASTPDPQPGQVLARPNGSPGPIAVPTPVGPPPGPALPAGQQTPARVSPGCAVAVVLLLLVAAGLLYAVGGVRVGSFFQSGPTPTPQTFVAQELRFENQEFVVPTGADPASLRSTSMLVFEELARRQLGPQARLQDGSFDYLGRPPELVRDDAQGKVYRVSMKGTMLVPKP